MNIGTIFNNFQNGPRNLKSKDSCVQKRHVIFFDNTLKITLDFVALETNLLLTLFYSMYSFSVLKNFL